MDLIILTNYDFPGRTHKKIYGMPLLLIMRQHVFADLFEVVNFINITVNVDIYTTHAWRGTIRSLYEIDIKEIRRRCIAICNDYKYNHKPKPDYLKKMRCAH